MEKKVLFIISDYLPNRNGGTIRLEKLIKYFPNHRVKSVVLTRKSGYNKGPDQINNAIIHRTSNLDLFEWGLKFFSVIKKSNFKSVAREKSPQIVTNTRFAANWIAPDTDIFWALGSVYSAYKIIKKHEIRVVYSSSPSSSVHVLGLILKLLLPNIKWITEYRDPWTFNPFRQTKPRLLENIDHYLEKKCTLFSDKIIVVSAYFKESFLVKYNFLNENKIDVITNGFDLEDFDLSKRNEKENHPYLSILHTGNFYEKRSLFPIVEALSELEKEDPDFSSHLKFVQYGKIDPKTIHFLKINNINSAVFYNTITHQECLDSMFGADWLLLVPGPGKGTMTGKIFEYIVARKPIIILADEGPAKQMVEDYNLGICLNPNDKSGIKNLLIKISKGFRMDISSAFDKGELNEFDRKVIANKVLQIIEEF